MGSLEGDGIWVKPKLKYWNISWLEPFCFLKAATATEARQIPPRNMFMVTPPMAHTMHGMCCVSCSVVRS